MATPELNPYAAPDPQDPVPDLSDHASLADRGTRFLAALIDSIVIVMVSLPLGFALGLYDGFPNVELSFGQTVLSGILSFGVWLAIQFYFLRSGQTVGKKITAIRMVDHRTGRVPPMSRLVLVRYLPVSVVSMVPFIGGLLALVDVLFIFSENRRCIHDRIAETKVVVAGYDDSSMM